MTVDKIQEWYFTFGHGYPQSNHYAIVIGTKQSAREEMTARYGGAWSMQYATAEEAGVEKFGLKKLDPRDTWV